MLNKLLAGAFLLFFCQAGFSQATYLPYGVLAQLRGTLILLNTDGPDSLESQDLDELCFELVAHDRTVWLKELFARGVSPDRVHRGIPLVVALVKRGHVDFAREIIPHLNYWQRNGKKATLMHLCAHFGAWQLIETLHAQKVDLEVTGEDGNTALTFAAQARQHESVVELLRLGANPRALNANLDSAATFLAETGDTETLAAIAAYDAGAIDIADDRGLTPLMMALKAGHLMTALTLVQAGADLQKVSVAGESAYELARPYPQIIAAWHDRIQRLQVEAAPLKIDVGCQCDS